jgi:hypothetical protein
MPGERELRKQKGDCGNRGRTEEEYQEGIEVEETEVQGKIDKRLRISFTKQ